MMNQSHEELLIVEDVDVAYGENVILRDVNFALRPGEALYLAGSNGSGKSSLIQVLTGLKRPFKGQVKVAEEELFGSDSARAKLGVVNHHPMLQAGLTAAQNLQFTARTHGFERALQRVEQAIDLFDLGELATKQCGELSRGQKQRVSIARAWITDPSIYLIDEPFTALDSHFVQSVNEILKEEVSRGKSLVLTSHDIQLGLEMATHVSILIKGRLMSLRKCPENLQFTKLDQLVEFFTSAQPA